MRSYLTLSIGLLAASIEAQITSPSGYLSKEGAGREGGRIVTAYAQAFGGLREGRLQQVDGELRKAGPRALTAIGFRPDHSVASGISSARSWRNVVLRLADGDLGQQGQVFAANLFNTPTMVFSGSVSWPALGQVQSMPAPWLSPLRFSFRASYLYAAKRDLCLDWNFEGGVLASGGNWGSTVRSYILDAVKPRNVVPWPNRIHKTAGTCADSSTTGQSGSAFATVSVYGKEFWANPSWADQVLAHVGASVVAPNST